ncbi:hypothetical protein [Nocardioides pantholopis]|uniref:hypothetical protein n=1 Tax=Nocardioides pantholopis TaxID=2483798 RepID=UPI000F09A3FE|nr:hypothetical protein [Nocardioides pantholopis]
MTDSDLHCLLSSTTRAFEKTLRAVLDGDKPAARQVLRGSAGRRRARAAASDAVRTKVWVPVPLLVEQLQFVADLGRVGDLVDQLARHVVGGGDSTPLSPARRMEVTVLLDAGRRRLRQLDDGPVAAGLEPGYRSCGDDIREVAHRCSRDRSATLALCSALAATLLHASRHATRAA